VLHPDACLDPGDQITGGVLGDLIQRPGVDD